MRHDQEVHDREVTGPEVADNDVTDRRVLITRLDEGGDGLRLAVKDLIDVAGAVTTAGSRVLAARAEPADRDATCMVGARDAGARIVGKANLVELAFGATGFNPWFGTPPNPLDPGRIPGGSSSGSAVAVATGLADVAYGTDTGGSIRIPAACCGVVGLKTTFGRIPVDGVRPLAPTLDSVGPMAADVASLIAGMTLLEPGFTPAGAPPARVTRLRLPAEGDVDSAVDAALAAAGFDVREAHLDGWDDAFAAGGRLLEAEAAATNEAVFPLLPEIDPVVAERLERGRRYRADRELVARDRAVVDEWVPRLIDLAGEAGVLAVPTLPFATPVLEDAYRLRLTVRTLPVNLARLPALALPAPGNDPLPASIQLIGAPHSEEVLVRAAAVIEAGIAR